ncbi:MAG TPA: phospholipase D-like domain-containing protein [Gemmatimonadales bacterium]|nr:phospholipase D-like domain-containing protein [Gemmatimonadales bacterium]
MTTPTLSTHPLSRAIDRATGARPIPGNILRHVAVSSDALDAMLEMIHGAQRWIHFENYIIHDDNTGCRFATAWAERARAGVSVRVLYDAFGCRSTSSAFWRELKSYGVDVRPFRPIWTSGPIDAFSRDHRKLLVVDGAKAMTGGLCIGDEWAGDPVSRRECWRDTMVVVCGPAVAALEGAFSRMWARAGTPLPDEEAAPPAAEECGPSAVRVIEGFPGQSRIYRAVQLLAAAVTERLWITDAYLVAPPSLYASFVDAARSGVDVRLMLPGTSDVPIVRIFTRTGYRELLDAGARIFEYRGPMLHAKTLVADHDWARVGSSNLNVSSLLGNYELDLLAEQDGGGLTATLATQFLHDMAQSREIVLMARRRLPSLPPKLVDAAAIQPLHGMVPAPAPQPLPPQHRRSLRERQAAAAMAIMQAAGGARRMLAGAAAVTFAIIGVALILFPLVTSAVLAIGALATSFTLAGYAVARRRRRRESDVP